jgi:hypothetical protein
MQHLMLRRSVLLGIALLTAGGVAIGLYDLGHGVIGIPRHALAVGSFTVAGLLAIACIGLTIGGRNGK